MDSWIAFSSQPPTQGKVAVTNTNDVRRGAARYLRHSADDLHRDRHLRHVGTRGLQRPRDVREEVLELSRAVDRNRAGNEGT